MSPARPNFTAVTASVILSAPAQTSFPAPCAVVTAARLGKPSLSRSGMVRATDDREVSWVLRAMFGLPRGRRTGSGLRRAPGRGQRGGVKHGRGVDGRRCQLPVRRVGGHLLRPQPRSSGGPMSGASAPNPRPAREASPQSRDGGARTGPPDAAALRRRTRYVRHCELQHGQRLAGPSDALAAMATGQQTQRPRTASRGRRRTWNASSAAEDQGYAVAVTGARRPVILIEPRPSISLTRGPRQAETTRGDVRTNSTRAE